MERKEFVNTVFKMLEQEHINLYHDISKEEFEKYKEAFLRNVDRLDEVHFEAGMLKLFALFKDAHTMYKSVSFKYVDAQIRYIGKSFYLKVNDEYQKIEKINNVDIEIVVNKLKELVPFEVEAWVYAFCNLLALVKAPKALQMIDCGFLNEQISYLTESGKEMIFKINQANQIYNPQNFYEYKLENNVLYIKYFRCRNQEDEVFEQFLDNIKKSLKEKPKAVLVDVRNNTGGSDLIMHPLTRWLKKENIPAYVLMNGATFSAGVFAVAELKKFAKAKLLGTDAGQPTRCYGNIKNLTCDGKMFSACERYFTFTTAEELNEKVKPFYLENYEFEVSDTFDYEGVIKPDIYIERKLEDLNAGVDGQLRDALKYIEKDLRMQKEKNI